MAKKIDYSEMAKACITHLVRETQVKKQRVASPQEAAEFVALAVLSAGDPGRECAGIISLNSANHVVDVRVLTVGTVNQAPVYPREVAKAALLANATAIILFHNHPGGQCRPSAEDLELTRHLTEALRHLDITLHDHLILAGNEIYSITAGRAIQYAAPAKTLF